VARGDTERVLEGEHLRQPGHQQEDGDRRQLVGGQAVGGEGGRERVDLRGAEALRVPGHLRADRLAVVGQRRELDGEDRTTLVGVEPPQRAQRAVGRDLALEADEALVGSAAEDLEEEVVHRAEVVVHQLRLQARLGTDPPGGDGGVAVLEQQLLGGVDEQGARLGVGGADAAGGGGRRRHPHTLPRPRLDARQVHSIFVRVPKP
jgi:hypothetical protein